MATFKVVDLDTYQLKSLSLALNSLCAKASS
ncbi:hypothetical protein ABIB00_007575 [Bradyrhizobium sp. LB14.3]